MGYTIEITTIEVRSAQHATINISEQHVFLRDFIACQ